ncbi:MAG: 50S ribosomal protein L18 [Calditrichales bacterium]|nr:MAG: 50S ribosomal protein L18 [Calditrichales bacterium]
MGKMKKEIHGTSTRPRLVVFRSLKYIYGQLIDDDQHKVIMAFSNLGNKLPKELKDAKTKTDASRLVGKSLGEMAVKKKIEDVIFDRNGYIYHGRIKAFADGARESGLKF